jgi:hypothetical protein
MAAPTTAPQKLTATSAGMATQTAGKFIKRIVTAGD